MTEWLEATFDKFAHWLERFGWFRAFTRLLERFE